MFAPRLTRQHPPAIVKSYPGLSVPTVRRRLHTAGKLLWRERFGIMGLTKLVVRGARQHNLKNISVEIPRTPSR